MVLREVLLAVIVLACTAGSAHATTFVVDGSSGSPGDPCTSDANACTTINAAITQARADNAGPHTIEVRIGTYNEVITLDQAEDSGLTIVGSGPGDTKIVPGEGPGAGISIGGVNSTDDTVTGVELQNLEVEVPALTTDRAGIFLNQPGQSLFNVEVDMQDANSGQTGVLISAGSQRLQFVVVGGAWAGNAIQAVVSSTDPDITILDSRLDSNVTGSAFVGVSDVNLLAYRTTFDKAGSDGPAVSLADSSGLLDSSLVLGGQTGVSLTAGAGLDTVRVRSTTIDVADAGEDDSDVDHHAVVLFSGGPNSSATAELRSSIAVEHHRSQQVSGASSSIMCIRSDVRDQEQATPSDGGSIACDSSPANTAGNSSSTPGDLFVNAAGGDYTPADGSPAIETGTADPIAPDESSTDREGNSRFVDFDCDGVVQRDKGAYELQRSEACPDADGDGVFDIPDNCDTTANPDQANADGDAQGNACDPDDDNDGAPDGADNCPTPNSDQANTDGDAQGDACDADDDNDTLADANDSFPTDPSKPGIPSSGNDNLFGTAGDNLICGLGGGDTVDADAGNDRVFGDQCFQNARLQVGALATDDGNDTLNGGTGNDSVYGSGGNDTQSGGDGNDKLSGGGGKDVLGGGNGKDKLDGGDSNDRGKGGAGNDSLKGGRGKDKLSGEDGNDSLSGGDGNDSLKGGRGKDKLSGGKGRNTYSGGDGNDTINAANRVRETVNCGSGGRDKATVDVNDVVRGCESVRRRR